MRAHYIPLEPCFAPLGTTLITPLVGAYITWDAGGVLGNTLEPG